MPNEQIVIKTLEELAKARAVDKKTANEYVIWFFNFSQFLNGKAISLEDLQAAWQNYLKSKRGLSSDELREFGIVGFF